ncbi:MAG: hypothetical protein CMK59_03765 [Proteobacteria bacterium]|nr:hypothetical protein [Pseudomonadota bacterium]
MSKLSELPLPPEELQLWVGGATKNKFWGVGEGIFQILKSKCHILPNSTILDIGCGCGRIASHLLDFLDEEQGGQYYGFDVHKPSISWAQENISSKNTNFQFDLLDVFNSMYNPGKDEKRDYAIWRRAQDTIDSQKAQDKINSENVRFPHPDQRFDCIFATSVYTHLTKNYLEAYIKESARVAKDGAYIFFTFFTTKTNMNEGWTDIRSRDQKDHAAIDRYSQMEFANPKHVYDDVSWVANPSIPCAVIIFKEDYITEVIEQAGLEILSFQSGWQAHWILKKKPSNTDEQE